ITSIIIISAGFKEVGAEGKKREEEIAEIAHKYGIRIIGPNCLGVIRPSSNLNATFARKSAKSGRVAFLSQSGALGTAVLDWAISRNIGFSAFASLGDMLDIGFGDLIDYFGMDPETRAILIYLESIGSTLASTKKFMSAARGFARNKPIIVIKPGKSQESRAAAKSHTGAMVSEDLYYDAMFSRAGVVRVDEIADLFNCASILNTPDLPKTPNLAFVTNAGGPSVLAVDALIGRGGKLAKFSPETITKLSEFIPAFGNKDNPVDVLGDASPSTYAKAIDTVLQDPDVGGVVVIYTPQGVAKAAEVAEVIIKYRGESRKQIIATFMGGEDVNNARNILYSGNIPTYEFPEEAVKTYLYMYQYSSRLDALYETPEDIPLDIDAPRNYLKVMVNKSLKEKKTLLSEEDSKKILESYGIKTSIPYLARNADEAVRTASQVGHPVVMKIASPDISHKSDVGGVRLNLTTDEDVREAFKQMMKEVKNKVRDAKINGVTIQRMVTGFDYELIIGSKKDPLLGPVLLFGLGGTEAEFFKDVAVGLPPLNRVLARQILQKTRLYSMLSKGFRSRPPANLALLDEILIKVSNMMVDFPEIKELDINPLAIHADAATALDARIILDEAFCKQSDEYSHLIISPYPTKYIKSWSTSDGHKLLLRPIRPEDESMEKELLANLSPESSHYRFFYAIKDITHEMLTRFCNIDYEREMAIIAEYVEEGKRRNVGVCRITMSPDVQSGEYAVVIADDFQGKGLGLKLSDMLIGMAIEKGMKSIYGTVLNDNLAMLGMASKLGFSIHKLSPEESHIELKLL
ncbi:MAG: bifunctional acetate--CoA ligase family protein/GNAT family N-acetyltransferase, partial [Dehalococcoidales bacterium]|nr:bifunctional acetate--CoA ligase family protein/GNAT family N-acetyltransferase [Dehalococcoidales bacterium]